MKSKIALVMLFFPLLLVVPNAWGATLDAFIDPWDGVGTFKVEYQQSYTIRHDDQGDLAGALEGQEWTIDREFDSSYDGVLELAETINSGILAERSQVTVSDLGVKYMASLYPRGQSSTINFKIIMNGNLNNYVITHEDALNPGIIDMGWRHFSIDSPVIIDGIDINTPLSVLATNSPDVYDLMGDTDGGILMAEPLMIEEAFDEPLEIWHSLFDPTGINVDANRYGLSDSFIDNVVSMYTLGESSIREGRKTDEAVNVTFTLDKEYFVKTVNTIDIGNLAVVGYTSISSLDDLETLGFSTDPIGTTTSTGGFPAHIVIGMSVLAAIGGGVFFIISHRQLKREKGAGQTGIDPSQLRASATSASAGGYQTNRGESHLRDDYDSGSGASPEIPEETTRGSMPKGWDKK